MTRRRTTHSAAYVDCVIAQQSFLIAQVCALHKTFLFLQDTRALPTTSLGNQILLVVGHIQAVSQLPLSERPSAIRKLSLRVQWYRTILLDLDAPSAARGPSLRGALYRHVVERVPAGAADDMYVSL